MRQNMTRRRPPKLATTDVTAKPLGRLVYMQCVLESACEISTRTFCESERGPTWVVLPVSGTAFFRTDSNPHKDGRCSSSGSVASIPAGAKRISLPADFSIPVS